MIRVSNRSVSAVAIYVAQDIDDGVSLANGHYRENPDFRDDLIVWDDNLVSVILTKTDTGCMVLFDRRSLMWIQPPELTAKPSFDCSFILTENSSQHVESLKGRIEELRRELKDIYNATCVDPEDLNSEQRRSLVMGIRVGTDRTLLNDSREARLFQ